MKTKPQHSAKPVRRLARRKQRGVAILIVLSVLVLMSVMVISFFSMAKSEQISAKGTAEINRNVALRDTALNLVIARIRAATTEGKLVGTTSQSKTLWVSQPGVLTTYKADPKRTDNGDPSLVYKLYSCKTPIKPATLPNNFSEDLDQTWAANPDIWVDINKPAFRPNLDPKKASDPKLGTYYYPIVDPGAFDKNNKDNTPEGFSYGRKSAGSGGVSLNEIEEGKSLPMPVMWLYVLRDGTIGRMQGSASSLDFVNDEGIKPSDDNPIVGRIAFWTDDESCKVNVNTAAEGVCWDTPRCDTIEERYYGEHIPPAGEYYRYPGHPAQVCLSSVLFPNKRFSPAGSGFKENGSKTAMTKQQLQLLLDLAPMVDIGVSQGGETKVPVNSQVFAAKEERLFPSFDELIFKAGALTNNERVAAGKTEGQFDEFVTRLNRAQFFLTAKSSAPELNLWGHPKLSMWPMFNTVDTKGFDNYVKATMMDEIISFTSRFGFEGSGTQNVYYVQRQDPDSRHHEMYVYNTRTLAICDYLTQMTNYPVPGFSYSNSFQKKYPAAQKYGNEVFSDCNQMVLEMVDYCRGINMRDPAVSAPYATNQYGQHAAFCRCGDAGTHANIWNRNNLQFPKGQGRVFGASEFAIWFRKVGTWTTATNRITTSVNPVGDLFTSGNGLPPGGSAPPDGSVVLEMAVVVEGFCSAQGWGGIRPQIGVGIGTGIGSNAVNTFDLSYTAGGYSGKVPANHQFAGNQQNNPRGIKPWGGYGGPRVYGNGVDAKTAIVSCGPIFVPPNASLSINASTSNPIRMMLFDTGTVASMQVGNLVQVYYLAPGTLTVNPGQLTTQSKSAGQLMKDAFNSTTASTQKLFDKNSGDWVKSMVPGNPDYRLVTGPRALDTDVFIKHPKWEGGNYACSLYDPALPANTYCDDADMLDILPVTVAGGSYGNSFKTDGGPFAPNQPEYEKARLDQKKRGVCTPDITGDFNNGVGNAPDGGFIGKVDEGDYRTSGTPYFPGPTEDTWYNPPTAKNYLAPNRIVSGPGLFGSVPSGVQNRVPWQTLLLRPSLYETAQNVHYGAAKGNELPPDHLLLDYFWMPVVEPYAISDPMTTRGKINLNYRIQPFSYITRATALHALMKPERILAIPSKTANKYKSSGNQTYRTFIDADKTLEQFELKFNNLDAKKRLFRSPSEICEMYLVPEGSSSSPQPDGNNPAQAKFWQDHGMTGDDSREAPYAHFLSRLTTRSNVYRVHFISQTIQKAQSSDPSKYVPGKDTVTSEYRGSAVVERSIDAADPDLAKADFDYVVKKDKAVRTLDAFYNYRIVEVKQFAP